MPAKKTTTTKTAGPARPKAVSKSPKTVADLTPNASNPRKPWSSEQRAAFQKSLAEFGDLSGIVFNKTTGQLVGGHKRVEEFKEDPDAKIVSEPAEGKPKDGTLAYGHVTLATGTRFAYREVSWPKAKEAAANLAANQWGAEWDWEGVSELLAEAKNDGFDLTITGFSHSEFEPLLAADWSPPKAGELPGAKEKGGEEPKQVDGEHQPHHIGLSDEAYGALANAKRKGKHLDWSTTILALCGK